MYNFDFQKDEELIEVFDDIWVGQGEQEKTTTIALTNQRLLFLDYDPEDMYDNLRIAEGINYTRYKEVYYQIKLTDITNIDKSDTITINLKNGTSFDIDNEELYKLLEEELKTK